MVEPQVHTNVCQTYTISELILKNDKKAYSLIKYF